MKSESTWNHFRFVTTTIEMSLIKPPPLILIIRNISSIELSIKDLNICLRPEIINFYFTFRSVFTTRLDEISRLSIFPAATSTIHFLVSSSWLLTSVSESSRRIDVISRRFRNRRRQTTTRAALLCNLIKIVSPRGFPFSPIKSKNASRFTDSLRLLRRLSGSCYFHSSLSTYLQSLSACSRFVFNTFSRLLTGDSFALQSACRMRSDQRHIVVSKKKTFSC